MRVQGVLDGAGYEVEVTGRADRPVVGSVRVAALVDAAVREGRRVLLGPTGPVVAVTSTGVESILALLARETAVTGTDAPVEPPAGPARRVVA